MKFNGPVLAAMVGLCAGVQAFNVSNLTPLYLTLPHPGVTRGQVLTLPLSLSGGRRRAQLDLSCRAVFIAFDVHASEQARFVYVRLCLNWATQGCQSQKHETCAYIRLVQLPVVYSYRVKS